MSQKYPGVSAAHDVRIIGYQPDEFGKNYLRSNVRKKRNIMRKRGLLK